MRRRDFLSGTILGTAGLALFGPGAWLGRALAATADSSRRLIVVFLRGAVDGLNVVIPHAEAAYYQGRPSIAIAPAAVRDLDGRFGLHPALASIEPLWREHSLAFVHACGSPDPNRSHFEAQAYMETATPGIPTTPDGWMNRLLAVLPGPHSATEAINLGPVVPRILSGRMAVANLPLGPRGNRPIPLDRPRIEEAFARLYQGNDPLSRAFNEGYQARRKLLSDLDRDMRAADGGAPYPGPAFQTGCDRLGRLMAHDPSIRLAFVALGGWDTHVNQGSNAGQLANHLRPLGDGLMSLVKALGSAYQNTAIVVMSEFGRTARENGNGGTDHGHGNVMWVMGGGVGGGKVYGNWPGLSEAELYQGRDLAITTDFRTVLGVVMRRHLGIDQRGIQTILPGFGLRPDSLGSLIRV